MNPRELYASIGKIFGQEVSDWENRQTPMLPHEADRIEWRIRLSLAENCSEATRHRMESYINQGRRA